MYESKPYFYGTGRRKHSVARVRVYNGTGKVTINGRDMNDYFGLETLKLLVNSPLVLTENEGKFDVVVINCDQAILTGKKAEQKFHITHSKYIGGLKKVQYSKLMAENSDLAMTYAVKGMIPSNTIGAKALTRLHCYQGAEHAHAAQKPEKIEF